MFGSWQSEPEYTDTSASESELHDHNTDANTKANSKSILKNKHSGTHYVDFNAPLKSMAPAKEKEVFKPSEGELRGIFSSTRKDSNIKKQKQMMASIFGSARELPTSADMSLETLAHSTKMGIRPYHMALMNKSASRMDASQAKVVRRSLNMSSVNSKGKLEANNESIENIMCDTVELKAVASIIESSKHADARDWLATCQKTPTFPPSCEEDIVAWLMQLYSESYEVHRVSGKAVTALAALTNEISDPDLKDRFIKLLDIQVAGGNIIQQHAENLLGLKTAIKYQVDKSAFRGLRETLKKRAEEYRIKLSGDSDVMSHYDDIKLDADKIEGRLSARRKLYNKRQLEKKRKNKQYTSRYQPYTPRDKGGQPEKNVPRPPKPPRKKKIVCYLCGAKGHKKSSCPEMICQYCNEKGHSISKCPKRKADSKNQ